MIEADNSTSRKSVTRVSSSRLLTVLAGLGAPAGLLPFVGRWSGRYFWAADLFSHFPAQALIVAIFSTLWFLSRRQWRWVGLSAIAITLNGIAIAEMSWPPGATEVSGVPVRVVSLNTYFENNDIRRIVAEVERIQPDLLYICELTPGVDAAMRQMSFVADATSRVDELSPWGAGIYSRYPLIDVEYVPVEYGCPTIRVTANVNGTLVTFVGAHPVPPAGPRWTRLRDDTLLRTAKVCEQSGRPVVLVGDFNATPWSYSFRDVLAKSGLKDARQGWGFRATWHDRSRILWIPIDHILASSDVAVSRFEIGSDVGSDHRPVIADLRVCCPGQ